MSYWFASVHLTRGGVLHFRFEAALENIQIVLMVAVIHFTFVLSAIGISFAERLTRERT